MNSHFTATFFSNNRAKLRQKLKFDYPVVLAANGELQRTADTTFPFQQESNFWYLSGIEVADMILVIEKDTEYIILPDISTTKAIFDGTPDVAAITQRSGIARVFGHSEGWDKLRTTLRTVGHTYTHIATHSRDSHSGMYTNPAQKRCLQTLRRKLTNLQLHDVTSTVAELRTIKQSEEIAAIQQAITISCDTLADVRAASQLSTYAYEYELEAAITQGFRSRGASGHAYTPIVASGSHATTLHYVTNNGAIRNDELVVLDVGAEVEHYAADITRTVSKQTPSARQSAVLNEVLQLQSFACSLLKPGTLLRDYERAVCQKMGEALMRLKLINNTKDIAAIRKYYPHATSHFLGLDVHDTGNYTAPLQKNMILTCEPGIYIPEEGIGVRIEDDILITEKGHKNLSADCSYEAFIL